MIEDTPSADIIKGPWKRTTNSLTKKQIFKAEQLAYCEEISDTCLMSILEILVKNGIDVSDESFIRDITFLTESIKASILKLHGIDHPIQGLIEITTELQIDPNDTTFCELDEDTITSLIATYNSIMMKD